MAKSKAKATLKSKSTGASATKSKAAPKASSKGTSALSRQASGKAASKLIDRRIRDLGKGKGGWRGETLAHMRKLILEADPEIVEEWKWMGTPVWSHPQHGIVCTGESYAKVIKLTFARGASVKDPSRLFNSSLEGNTRRAIDIREGEKIDAAAFRTLVKAAVAESAASKTLAKARAKAK